MNWLGQPTPCRSRQAVDKIFPALEPALGARAALSANCWVPRAVVPWLLATLLATACARNVPPTGGPEDRFPPYVVATLPDTFSTVEPGARDVWFHFSERISERPATGTLDDAVVVSPSTGDVRVKHGRHGITVRVEEGFAPGLVYRVTVLPVIKDMFGNALPDPFDLVFSTGGPIVPNVVAGMVEDRVSGKAAPGVRVAARFVLGDDTLTHWNFSDSGGVFSLRYVPEGPFEAWAWQDLNRDGEVGGSEPRTSFRRGEVADSPDTTLVVLTLIQPDTTPPRLARATPEDSVTLKIEIDDYIEPDLAEGSITGVVTVVALDTASADEDSTVPEGDTADAAAAEEAGVGVGDPEDTVAVAGEPVDTLGAGGTGKPAGEGEVPEPVPLPEVGDTIRIRIFQEREYEVWVALREDSIARAREDSIAQAREDSIAQAREDSIAQAREDAEAEVPANEAGREVDWPGRPGGGAASREAEAGTRVEEGGDSVRPAKIPRTLSGLRLPSQSLVGVLEEALMDRVEYELVVEGVVNIAGVAGGGGVDTLRWEPPAAPDATTAAEDSAQAGDSVQPRDSAQAGDSVQPRDSAQPVDDAEVSDTTQAADTTTDGAARHRAGVRQHAGARHGLGTGQRDWQSFRRRPTFAAPGGRPRRRPPPFSRASPTPPAPRSLPARRR